MAGKNITSYRRKVFGLSIVFDWLSTSVAWLGFNCVRFMLLNVGFGSLGSFLLSPKLLVSQVLFPLVMLAVYWLSGYYNEPLRRSRLRDMQLTFFSALAGTLAVLVAMLLDDLTPNLDADYLLLATLFVLLFTFVFIPRVLLSRSVIRCFALGRAAYRTIVVTDGEGCAEPLSFPYMEVIGQMPAAEATARAAEADCFILAPARDGSLRELMPAAGALMSTNKPIYIMAQTGTIVERRYNLTMLSGANRASSLALDPLIDISQSEMAPSTLNIKRVTDVVLSAAALVVTGPLILLLGAAVRLTSPGPAFYRQRRVGYHRRPFDIIKLRTMREDAEASGPRLASDEDPRVTRLGHILRKYRLDELPQFINVIRGDMSLVGPRPERPHFVEQILAREPFYALIHQVRPGLTSWGMVSYGYASSVDQMIERLRYDLLYLENVGFTLDFKIMLHTIRTIVTGKGL